MLIWIRAGKLEPCFPTIVVYPFRQLFSQLEEQREYRNQQDDTKDDKEEVGSQQPRQECPANRSGRGGNFQEHPHTQIGEMISHVGRSSTARCGDDGDNAGPVLKGSLTSGLLPDVA